MQIDDWNRMAVRTLLADAGRTLALLEVENLRGNQEVVPEAMAHARRSYFNFVRRGRPLIMSTDDQVAFQRTLDHLTETGIGSCGADEALPT
jgi:hypothetical protein